jgi:Protein tyrosine and serine/threonine kinase
VCICVPPPPTTTTQVGLSFSSERERDRHPERGGEMERRVVGRLRDTTAPFTTPPWAAVVPSACLLCAGTITHQAPEVLEHGLLSQAADVYSFGVLLWQVGVGRRV